MFIYSGPLLCQRAVSLLFKLQASNLQTSSSELLPTSSSSSLRISSHALSFILKPSLFLGTGKLSLSLHFTTLRISKGSKIEWIYSSPGYCQLGIRQIPPFSSFAFSLFSSLSFPFSLSSLSFPLPLIFPFSHLLSLSYLSSLSILPFLHGWQPD